MSQYEAATILGVHPKTYTSWEYDTHKPGTAPSYLELLRKMKELGHPLEE